MTWNLMIAGVRLEVSLDESIPRLPHRYLAFTSCAGDAVFALRVCDGRAVALDRVTGRVKRDGGLLQLEGLESLCYLDLVTCRGVVVADPHWLAFDWLVRAAVQLEIIRWNGLLLHAAAVMVDGRGYLFPGVSGSGKSTLASRAGDPLCDELCAVVPDGHGFALHGTPWWRGRAGSAPLARVLRLSWEGEGVRSETRGALRHLAANLMLAWDDSVQRTAAFAAAARVCASVPFGEIGFQPDSDVDTLVRESSVRAQ